jgi:hypothetical protein
MSDLAAFIEARLDDDEHFARTMTEVGERYAATASSGKALMAGVLAASFMCEPGVAEMVERYADGLMLPPNNLERILRDVAAKRAILADMAPPSEATAKAWSNEEHTAHEMYGALILRDLAAIWRDHPDYGQVWAR